MTYKIYKKGKTELVLCLNPFFKGWYNFRCVNSADNYPFPNSSLKKNLSAELTYLKNKLQNLLYNEKWIQWCSFKSKGEGKLNRSGWALCLKVDKKRFLRIPITNRKNGWIVSPTVQDKIKILTEEYNKLNNKNKTVQQELSYFKFDQMEYVKGNRKTEAKISLKELNKRNNFEDIYLKFIEKFSI